MNDADKHFELAVGIAKEALKTLFLFNAGAAAALIALTDRSVSHKDYSWAILCFGLGALTTALAFILGYFSQVSYANHLLEKSNSDPNASARAHCQHKIFQFIAIVFVIASMIAGSVGMYAAFAVAKAL